MPEFRNALFLLKNEPLLKLDDSSQQWATDQRVSAGAVATTGVQLTHPTHTRQFYTPVIWRVSVHRKELTNRMGHQRTQT